MKTTDAETERLIKSISISATDWYRAGMVDFAEGMAHALTFVLIGRSARYGELRSEGAIAAAAIAIGFSGLVRRAALDRARGGERGE